MLCKQCGQAVPEGANSCPSCSGNGGASDREVKRSAIAGGLKGLFLGLLPMVVLLMEYRAEPGVVPVAIAIPVVTFAAGFLIAFLKARRDRK
ncbi:MAG: hypothetical protein H6R14_2311 [Proteobacteria bacterium]|nr:hypothetical protein [Pseudomonadota bacterium]